MGDAAAGRDKIASKGLKAAMVVCKRKFMNDKIQPLLSVRQRLENLPAFVWILAGVFPVLLAYYIAPIYFNDNLQMNYPRGYIPLITPIGFDFRQLLSAMEDWFLFGQTGRFIFPPLALILFSPFLAIGYPASYFLITIITLISYTTLGLLAGLVTEKRNHAIIVLMFVLSFFLYGLQVELERGQTYTLSFALCFLAIYLFHSHPGFRFAAYLLFCIAVQMKFYPALFVILLIDDWRDWKRNLLRFGALGLANFLLLFLLGRSYFSAFINHMGTSLTEEVKAELWFGNHSIKAFVMQLPKMEIEKFGGRAAEWANNHANLIEYLLYGYFFFCFASILLNAWRKNVKGVNVDLLLAGTIGALTLPPINHDYTLPMLVAPFAIAVSAWSDRIYPWPAFITNLIIAFASAVYAILAVPPLIKPPYFANALIPLFIILTFTTLLALVSREKQSLR